MSKQAIAMVFTDLVNSTAIKPKLPGRDITARNICYRDTILMPHRQRVESSIGDYGGRKVETIGDAFFLVFPNPIQAVQWAVALQNSHNTEPIPTPFGSLQVTIGMHTGNPLPDGDRFIGHEVDYAARVAALASAEQILLSEVTAALVRNAQIAGLGLHQHRDRNLKGIGEVPIFELLYNNKQPQTLKDGIKAGVDFWRKVCRDRLESQRRLTTNPLTVGDGIAFELDEIYVPLGLVERKQRDKHSGDISPEQGSQLYQPEGDAVTQKFQNDEFFEKVLKTGQSKKIAVLGEPGAGKTTLLQKIAFWVLEHTEGLPIWVSLADWQEKDKDLKLDQYLLQNWLKAVTRRHRVPPEIEDDLVEQFNQGRVWLLLDAADEMVGTQVKAPLQVIANQLTGWVAQGHVVLTCRLNVWDAGKNHLEAFETYRNLHFNPVQMGEFIHHWFKSNSEQGQRLQAELDKPGRERIRDAVKSPLRLALLCRTWQFGEGELPNTKAGLYEQFVEALYQWKEERFPTDLQQRQALTRCLGKLALQAMEAKDSRFRLRHSFICQVLGNPESPWFQLALSLGWLNQVGVAAEKPHEPVYAFFHPTFQEYFAAQAVEDWHFFLNHQLGTPLSSDTYRIFDPQWKEVILLWLGREDVPCASKEEFIKALVEFDDGCKDFYAYRAYCLAAAGIGEFGDCPFAVEIVTQVVKWSLGCFDGERNWHTLLAPGINGVALGGRQTRVISLIDRVSLDCLQKGAQVALLETESSRAIATLTDLLHSDREWKTIRRAAYSLGQINPGNAEAISALINLLHTCQERDVCWLAATSLGEIGAGNSGAISALTELLHTSEDKFTLRLAATSLGQIDPGNSLAISTLIELLQTCEDEDPVRRRIAESLGQIGTGNPEAIATLIHLIHTSQDKPTHRRVARSLGQIRGNSGAIAALIHLLHTSEDEYTRRRAAESLGQIDPNNTEAIAVLIELLHTSKDPATRRRAAESLGQIDPGNTQAIGTLRELLHAKTEPATLRQAAESLGQIDPGNTQAIDVLIELTQSSRSKSIRKQAARSLGEVAVGNSDAIAALISLLSPAQDEATRRQAAGSLGKIGAGNAEAIAALIDLLHATSDEVTLRRAVKSLGEIGVGNTEATIALIKLLHVSQDKLTYTQAAESLKTILQGSLFQTVVSNLKPYLSELVYERDDRYKNCYDVVWHCAQNLAYPAFYQAWHGQPPTSHPEVPETTGTGTNSLTQSLNLANLPQSLTAAIANDPTLSQRIHLICIDGNKFVDRDNPAAKIYTGMVKGGCPRCDDGTPKTMAELQAYWDLLETDKQVVLVFYESTTGKVSGNRSQVFTGSFLEPLSKFDGAICVITEQPLDDITLQFAANHPLLVENIVGWLRAIALENLS